LIDSVINSSIDQEFTPKDRSDKWRVCFGANTSSGYDFSLMIENPTTKVSYEVELGIMEDGRLCGQITPDQGGKGPDALILFDTTSETAHVSGNRGGARMIINVDDTTGPRVIDADTQTPVPGFN
jgi:hypothetical protein